jgi:hypothetical protein
MPMDSHMPSRERKWVCRVASAVTVSVGLAAGSATAAHAQAVSTNICDYVGPAICAEYLPGVDAAPVALPPPAPAAPVACAADVTPALRIDAPSGVRVGAAGQFWISYADPDGGSSDFSEASVTVVAADATRPISTPYNKAGSELEPYVVDDLSEDTAPGLPLKFSAGDGPARITLSYQEETGVPCTRVVRRDVTPLAPRLRLTSYGASRVSFPISRLFAFKVKCDQGPCTIALTARASTRHTGRTLRLPKLDSQGGARHPIRVSTVPDNYAVLFERSDFRTRDFRTALSRYGSVRLAIRGVVTDSTGAKSTQNRTITVVPKPKHKTPKPGPSGEDLAVKAVQREVSDTYKVLSPEVTCDRLTARRHKCHWSGLSAADIRNGNVDGWAGTATVTRYSSGGTDVTLQVTRYGD